MEDHEEYFCPLCERDHGMFCPTLARMQQAEFYAMLEFNTDYEDSGVV
jgi:hypothetical protein